MSHDPLPAEDAEELTWASLPFTLSDGRIVVERHEEFFHQSRWETHYQVVIRFSDEATFYGYLRREGSTEMQDSYWPDGPVELEPMVQVMKPSWEVAHIPGGTE